MLIDDDPEAGASRVRAEGEGYPMRWRSWRGADRSAETAKELIHGATRKADAVIQPTSALVMEIVSAGWGCTQTLKSHLRPSKEMVTHPELQQAYIFFDFLSFFIPDERVCL